MLNESPNPFAVLGGMTNDAVLEETLRVAASVRRSTVDLITAISEVDIRRLYRQEGCSSASKYCRDVLRLSEHAAYVRVRAARLARRFPIILEQLADGSLTLSNLMVVGPFLDDDNYQSLLAQVANKSKRDAEVLVATLRAPLASEFYRLELSVCRETWEQLQRLQGLLRPSIGDGDPSRIVEKALALLLVHVEKKKMAKVEHPQRTRPASPDSRHIPAGIKREVGERDGWQCAFVGPHGRCSETQNLEFHHLHDFAKGGPTIAVNLELRCRTHNQYEAEMAYGPRVRRSTRAGASAREAGPKKRAGP